MWKPQQFLCLIFLLFNQILLADFTSPGLSKDLIKSIVSKTEPSDGNATGNNFGPDLRKISIIYGISSLVKNESEEQCHKELREFKNALDLKRLWSLKVLDSSGQKGPGFLFGNSKWLGSKDQCMDSMNRKRLEVSEKIVNAKPTPYDHPPFTVNFAVSYFRHNNTQQFHADFTNEYLLNIGLCIPASCNESHLKSLLVEYFDEGINVDEDVFDLNLVYQRTRVLDYEHRWMEEPLMQGIIWVFGVTILIVIVGTLYELFTSPKRWFNKNKCHLEKENSINAQQKKRQSLIGQILVSFSLNKNARALMKLENAKGTLGAINGMRFLSMVWVILGHTTYYGMDFIDDEVMLFRIGERIEAQPLVNSTYCVDTFLVLSGFLLGYMFCKMKKKIYMKEKQAGSPIASAVEYVFMFVNRYLRLTPVYLYTLGLVLVLFTYYDKESMFVPYEDNQNRCREYWWWNVLYINNFLSNSKQCMTWTWYLAADTQFFLVALLCLYISLRFLLPGLLMLVALIIVQMCLTGYISHKHEITTHIEQYFLQADMMYTLPYHRMGPYFVGVLAGYMYEIILQEKLVLSKRALLICWSIFPAMCLWPLFGTYGKEFSREYNTFYFGLSRNTFAIGIAWLLIACLTDNAGIINKFLSHKAWVPLSRLSYTAYIINAMLTTVIRSFSERTMKTSPVASSMEVLANLCVTLLATLPYSLCFETPFVRLSKILLAPMMPKKTASTDNTGDKNIEENTRV